MGVSLGLDYGAITYQPHDLTAAWEGCHLSSEGCGVGYVGWCAWSTQQGDHTWEALADGEAPCLPPQHLPLLPSVSLKLPSQIWGNQWRL